MRAKSLLVLLVAFNLIAAEPEHDPGDGGPAREAFLNFPENVALDVAGNLYISERGGNRIRRVDRRSGVITTVAGTGEEGYGGDGGPAVQAKLTAPTAIVIDRAGNLIIGDTFNYRIRKVDARTGIISTIAGTGEIGFSGDGGPATKAQISAPFGIYLDDAGNLYFTDTETHRIRRIDGRSGVITTVAGNGLWGFSGDGGPALQASLARPHSVTMDPQGNLIIGDSFNARIRRIDSRTGIIQTIAGSGLRGSSGDGGPASSATFCYFGELVFEDRGDMLVSGICDQRIRRIDLRKGTIHPFAGNGEAAFSGDGGPAQRAAFFTPAGMARGQGGNLYIADMRNHRIRRIDARTGRIETVAGSKEPRNPVITWRFVYNREQALKDYAIPVNYPAPSPARERQDISYADNPLQRFDLYLPKGPGRHPVVVLVSGRNDLEIVPDTWGDFISRGRILAAHGIAAVMFNHRLGLNGTVPQASEDLSALLDHLRARAAELEIDPDRIAIAGWGMGAASIPPLLRPEPSWLRAVVLVHPYLDVRELYEWQAPGKTGANAELLSWNVIAKPMLLVRAGKDAAPINAGTDRFIAEALKANAPLEVINHSTGDVGFEKNSADARVPPIIDRIAAFLRENLR